MIRNRVSWGLGLMALLLLTLGLAACGGNEPTPVVRPPAPPPAPPPFQPQAVEVALGESGENITLMTTEGGGFTLNGEALESGATVEGNGNTYLLVLADGSWTAAYQATESMVTLGITEEMVTLTKAEDGSYWLGDMAVTSGETTATAMNGNVYTLSMGEDGMWMATYVEPVFNVMLGASGETAMVKKAEDGSYWLGDMTVTSGETAATAMNGNEYTLTMGEDGMWMATYVASSQNVTLGTSGTTVMLTKAEDGSYWLGDMTVTSGETAATAMNGNEYTLTMGEDGMWMATYVASSQNVMLGTSGTTVMLTKAEDGSYWYGDQGVMNGSTASAANGDEYSLMMGEDGVWMATYVSAMGTVAIGASGISIPAMRDEAGNWTAVHPLTGETINLTEGGTVMATNLAGNANTYTLSSDGAGMWTAAYQAVMVSVMLGSSGSSAMLTRAEDGSYWYGDEPVMSGGEVMAENGNDYVLTMADGAWSAMFRPDTMEIKGTGLMAYTREDDDMYDVEAAGSGITLAASGAGDVTTMAGAMYRVSMMDGMLSGVRLDGAPMGDTVHVTVGLVDSDLAPDTHVSYIGDDRNTDANEANTMVTVAGENISLGDLLGSGMAAKAAVASDGLAGEFVESAIDLLMDLLTEAELYAKYQAAAEDDAGRGAFDLRLNNIAERAQGAIDTIFGTYTMVDGDNAAGTKKVNLTTDGTIPMEDQAGENAATDYIRAIQTVRGLNRLLDALSSADAFVDATKGGNNGVFEDALGEDAARKAFSANKSEYTVYLGTTASTRYGAIALKQRVSAQYGEDEEATVEAAAVYGTRFAFDGATTGNDDDNVEVGRVGAFSYANVNDTLRARNLPQTGGAIYSGGTIAVTPAGTLYDGGMRIDVNFRQQSVFGRVTELRDKDNNLWKYLDSDVTTIYLPRQDYNNLTQFGGVYDTDDTEDGVQSSEDDKRTGMGDFLMATVVYADSPGFSTTPAEQPANARFAGRFIGTDGAEITGTWSLGQPVEGVTDDAKSNDLDVIYGSYGVTRQDGEGPVGPADGTSGGAAKTTVVLPGTVDGTSLGATFEGDKDVAAILRLGKRSTGGGNDVNNDFDLQTIFASPGADPKKTVNNSPKHVAVVVDHIMAQRAIYVIYAEQVGGDSADTADLANVGRQNAWKSINDFVRDHIFDVAAVVRRRSRRRGRRCDMPCRTCPPRWERTSTR